MEDDSGHGSRGARATDDPSLREAVRAAYGLAAAPVDLGGSSSLNLLADDGVDRFVVRVYRAHVTAGRLADIQRVRRVLREAAVPVAQTVRTREGAEWVVAGGRLVEVERFVEHDAAMSSWPRLARGMPWLARIHSVLAGVTVGPEGRHPLFANHVHAADVLEWTRRGTERMRRWGPREVHLAEQADRLAEAVDAAMTPLRERLPPPQLVHGDFWDDNVLLRRGRVVLVTDFEFVGERPRIDDLALTLYFAESTLGAVDEDGRLGRLCALVDAYDSALSHPLSPAERAALPVALARQPLWGIGRWVALLDDEAAARRHAATLTDDLRRARQVLDRLPRWQAAMAGMKARSRGRSRR